MTTDKRSGIVNDPNNPDDEQYIVRLVGQVITVSLETVEIVRNRRRENPDFSDGRIRRGIAGRIEDSSWDR